MNKQNNEHLDADEANADGCKSDKIKTVFAKIVVGGSSEKPYYYIMWFDNKEKNFNIGYGSFTLDFVFEWLSKCFEIIDRSFSLEELEAIANAMKNNQEETK